MQKDNEHTFLEPKENGELDTNKNEINSLKSDTTTNINEPKKLTPDQKQRKRKKGLLTLFTLVFLGLTAYGVHWYKVARFNIVTDNAYVAGNQVQIMPEINGMVQTIHVENTDYVDAGELLVTLDPTDAEQSFEKAKSTLAQAVREINQAKKQLKQSQAIINQKRIELEQSQKDLNRRQQLIQSHAIGKEELQHAQDAVNLARSLYEESQQSYLANQALILDTPISEQPSVIKASTELKEAWLKLQRTKIISPVSGFVSRRSVQLGSQVNPNLPLMVIVPSDNFWIDANFKETQLSQMRIGQKAKIITDLYGDDVVFTGTVKGIDMGTGSAFSLLPAQNATGNWIKIVQRVPVRIEIQPDPLKDFPLRIGLSSTVSINTKDNSGPPITKKNSVPKYQTKAIQLDLTPINLLISQIIQENLENPL